MLNFYNTACCVTQRPLLCNMYLHYIVDLMKYLVVEFINQIMPQIEINWYSNRHSGHHMLIVTLSLMSTSQ